MISFPNIVTVIQVRVGSSRLPRKSVLDLQGEPLFYRVYERVQAARLTGTVVIATTVLEEDDEIELYCKERNILCTRGSVNDLLSRHLEAAEMYYADVVVKIPSDCPLIDPAVIDRVIGYYVANQDKYDYVSNLHPATYPDGNDVEVMTIDALRAAFREAVLQMEREHTTPFIWERPERFRIGNIPWETGLDYSMKLRWTVDYPDDYLLIAKIYQELYPLNKFFGLTDIVKLLAAREELLMLNQHLNGVNWYRHHLHELKTISAHHTQTNI